MKVDQVQFKDKMHKGSLQLRQEPKTIEEE